MKSESEVLEGFLEPVYSNTGPVMPLEVAPKVGSEILCVELDVDELWLVEVHGLAFCRAVATRSERRTSWFKKEHGRLTMATSGGPVYINVLSDFL